VFDLVRAHGRTTERPLALRALQERLERLVLPDHVAAGRNQHVDLILRELEGGRDRTQRLEGLGAGWSKLNSAMNI